MMGVDDMDGINSTLYKYLEGEFGGEIHLWMREHHPDLINSLKVLIYDLDESCLYHLNKLRIEVSTFISRACRQLRIPFSPDILNLLAEVEQGGVMYSSYRDHYLHSVLVFIWGCYIVDRSNTIKSWFSKIAEWPELFIRTWYVSAIYHDIGYSVMEKDFDLVNKRLNIMNDLVYLEMVQVGIDTGIKKHEKSFWEYILWQEEGKHMQDSDTFQYIKEFAFENWERLEFDNFDVINASTWKGANIFNDIISDDRMTELGIGDNLEQYYHIKVLDHGILSALFLKKFLKLREVLLTTESNACYSMGIDEIDDKSLNIACALEAIAVHNIRPDEPMRMNLIEDNPYAWLLAFCDGTQCWNRSYFGPDKYRCVSLSSIFINIELDSADDKLIWNATSVLDKEIKVKPDWGSVIDNDVAKILKIEDIEKVIKKSC